MFMLARVFHVMYHSNKDVAEEHLDSLTNPPFTRLGQLCTCCVQDIGCMHGPYNDELSDAILSPIGGLIAIDHRLR